MPFSVAFAFGTNQIPCTAAQPEAKAAADKLVQELASGSQSAALATKQAGDARASILDGNMHLRLAFGAPVAGVHGARQNQFCGDAQLLVNDNSDASEAVVDGTGQMRAATKNSRMAVLPETVLFLHMGRRLQIFGVLALRYGIALADH